MMKFESVAKVGEYIKAMDFRPMENRDDSFVIGKILREDYRGGFRRSSVRFRHRRSTSRRRGFCSI